MGFRSAVGGGDISALGSGVLTGSGTPDGGTGSDGDSYVDTASIPPRLYSPKAAGAWPTVPTALAADPVGMFNVSPASLRRWRIALARQRSGGATAKVIFLSDSVGYGAGLSTAPVWLGAWTEQVRTMLQRRYGGPPGGFVVGWEGPGGQDTRVTGNGMTSPGGLGPFSGARAIPFPLDTNYFQVASVNCDRIRLHIIPAEGATNSGMKVLVDGVVKTAAQTRFVDGRNYFRFDYLLSAGTVDPGDHTIRLTGFGGVDDGYALIGLEYSLGDPDTYGGVSAKRIGFGGKKSADLVANATNKDSLTTAFDIWAADLYVLAVGINDFYVAGVQIPVATYKANMATAIARAQSLNADVLLISPLPWYSAGVTPTIPLSSYINALYELAVQYNVPLIDFTKRWGSRNGSTGPGDAFFGDAYHPTDIGHGDIAAAVYTTLTSADSSNARRRYEIVKAGAIVNGDFAYVPPDGTEGLDVTNHRVYTKSAGAWKYAALT